MVVSQLSNTKSVEAEGSDLLAGSQHRNVQPNLKDLFNMCFTEILIYLKSGCIS